MDEFDVVIAGAGPAGLKCAGTLASSGLSVLVLEKNREFCLKACAGGLAYKADGFIADIDRGKTLSFSRMKIMTAKGEFFVDRANPVIMVDRKDLGEMLAKPLRNADNVEIARSEEILGIRGNSLETTGRQVRFRYLVGADGSSSFVRRHLGLETRMNVTLQYKIPRQSDDMALYINTELLGSGYGWIFPHRGYTSVGIMYDPSKVGKDRAKRAIATLSGRAGLDTGGLVPEGAPISYAYMGTKFGNVYLAGDAAGMASRATGEGILQALISGHEIALKILDDRYSMTRIAEAVRIKKRQEWMLQFFERIHSESVYFGIYTRFVKYMWYQRYFGL